jgi:ATP-dependent DNA helicase RecG
VLYADLDVSDLRTPPAGRVPIRTGIRQPDRLEPTWAKVRDEAAAGHRTFVVVPLIEEGSEGVDDGSTTTAAAAESEAVRLNDLLAPLRVGLVHGRMKPIERDAEMARFRDGELDVLVGTTVIEVGVDVSEATMMVIENADRFGLAQLHQFRGRVGRGGGTSYCLLLADEASQMGEERLQMMESTTDGFVLAEADLRMRGPGDFLGKRQSGLPDLSALQTGFDSRLLDQARRAAQQILDRDPDLNLPEHLPLRRQMAVFWASAESDLPGT